MSRAKESCIAVFDLGTSALKASLFSSRVEERVCQTHEYAMQASGTRVEARPELYLSTMKQSLDALRAAAPECAIEALVLTTQGETLLPVDRRGEALYPFIVWLDSRAEEEAAYLSKLFPRDVFYRTSGLPEITAALPLAKVLWLRAHEPEVFSRTHKFLLLEDYLLFRLTGRFCSEKSLQSSTGWFDLAKDAYWDEAFAQTGLDPQLFPELLESGQVAGSLLREAAQFFGLSAGIPVVAGAMDQTAAALGLGCTKSGVVCETTGTALVMCAYTEQPVFDSAHPLTLYRHAQTGAFLYLPIANTAGLALRWFRDEFCRDLPAGKDAYRHLDALAASVAPGCEGLTFLPFLSGSVDPEYLPDARAVFFGAGLASTRAHFARSIMEAIAFQLRDFSALLSRRGCPIDTVYSLGGGAQSPLWQQIKADVCKRNFEVPAYSEAASLGAALLAARALGMLTPGEGPPSLSSTLYRPRAAYFSAYDEAYARYQDIYSALKPLFASKESRP